MIRIKNLLKRKGALAENEIKDILKYYGLKTPKYELIRDIEDLDGFDLKFPVALKVCSSKILHKTDVGGVKLNIENMNDLKKSLKDFIDKFPKEKFLVEEMVKKGVEVIIGLVQDPAFGLCIMCGIGGIYTELYQDVSFRVVPIEEYDARDMIEEIRGKKLLEGFRNIKTNKEIVVDLLMKTSKIGEKLIDKISEMDLNPVFIYENDYCIVDAKLILKRG